MNPLLNVYRDGTIEGRISPRRYSCAATNFQQVTLQAPRFLEEVENDFLKVQYRALSQALVWQEGWLGMVVTDFSKNDILKASTPLLEGITVMPDHKFSTMDYLGIVEETFWTEDINGVPVSGIDAIYKLDIDPDPTHPSRRILRGVQHGYIKGSSVRVWFDYEKSHPQLDDWEFYDLMGSEVGGQVVRFIATHIRRYLETSIVIAGADPLAAPVEDVEDGTRADLAASFSQSGWSLPERPVLVSLSDNQPHKEKSPMARKKTQNLDVEEQVVDDVVEAPEDGEQTPVKEDLEQEQVDTPDPEDDTPVKDPVDDDQDTQQDDAEQATTSALSTEMDAAIKDAVAQALQAQQEAFNVEKAELEAARDQAFQEKATTERRFQLESFYADLQTADLPASFDELHIVDGLMALSQELSISIGDDERISPLTWAKMLLSEAAKYAKVPTERLASHAKAPTNADHARNAALEAAIRELMDTKQIERRDALKQLATTRPDLFDSGE